MHFLRGLENTWVGIYTALDHLRQLLDILVEMNLAAIEHYATAGVDSVRCCLVGETSSRYFVADALRCIDYLETQPDVDLSRVGAMTGVSGGGTTIILVTLLDERIAVSGPSCCL